MIDMSNVLQFRPRNAPPERAQTPPDSVSIEEAVKMFRGNRGIAAVLTHYGFLHRDGRLVDHAGIEHQIF